MIEKNIVCFSEFVQLEYVGFIWQWSRLYIWRIQPRFDGVLMNCAVYILTFALYGRLWDDIPCDWVLLSLFQTFSAIMENYSFRCRGRKDATCWYNKVLELHMLSKYAQLSAVVCCFWVAYVSSKKWSFCSAWIRRILQNLRSCIFYCVFFGYSQHALGKSFQQIKEGKRALYAG